MFGSLFDILVICYANRIKDMYGDEEEADNALKSAQEMQVYKQPTVAKRQQQNDYDFDEEVIPMRIPDSHYD